MGSIEFLVQMRKYILIVAMCLVAWTMNVYAEYREQQDLENTAKKIASEDLALQIGWKVQQKCNTNLYHNYENGVQDPEFATWVSELINKKSSEF